MGKVTRPILTGVFPRKRLFGLLDHMRKRPVVWVSGPAGGGKTSLVSSYLEVRGLPCLWYQLDAGDADLATFFYYLGQAAKRAAPRKGKPLPLLTPEYLQGIPTFTLRYFEKLYDRLQIPSILVFDNYQEVPEGSPFHESILSGLSHIPEGINVILVSRSDPPPALIRLRANHQMEILGWDELRLTLEESREIVRLRSKQGQSKERIQQLHRASDGWAAGLILMLESVKKGLEPELLGKLTPEEIFDYFGRELFDKTDREVQEFFLKTAFLHQMTAAMTEELTGFSSTGRILSMLSRNHYFTEKRLDTEPVYQYHPLYREFLLSRAREAFSPETISELQKRAAMLLEAAGQTEAAVSLFRDGGHWEDLVPLILKHAPILVAQGRNQTLIEWLSSFPKEVLHKHAWLLYWMGESLLPFNPPLSREYFEKAFGQFEIQRDPEGIYLAWTGVVDAIRNGLEDFKLLDHWIDILQDLMDVYKEFPSKEIEARVSSSMLMSLAYRQPHNPEIEEWEERALSTLNNHPAPSAKLTTLMRVVFYRTSIGHYEKAMAVMNTLQQLTQIKDVSPLAAIYVRLAEAIYYRSIEPHEKCLEAMAEGWELCQTSGIHIPEHMLLFHGLMYALTVNDRETVEKWLEIMGRSSVKNKPFESYFYYLLRTREALHRRAFTQALFHADLALKFSLGLGAPITMPLCYLLRAHAMHEVGKDQEAKESLSQVFKIARDVNGKSYEFCGLLAEALFGFDRGDETAGMSGLRQALALGRERGYLHTYIDQPFALARICVKALEAGIEVDYVQYLIRKCNIISEKASLHLENWPWPLKIFSLGRFELIKDGEVLRFPRKAQQKPLSLLKVLIAFGGRRVREDQIADTLWPNAEGDMAHQSFETTRHRLRKLIGYEKAIQLSEGRLTVDDRFCWVDFWAFEQFFGEAEAHWKDGLLKKLFN